MSPEDPRALPERVRDLLLGPIDSFEKLEIVIALHARRDPPWALEAPPLTSLRYALEELIAAGIVARQADGALRIAPGCDRTAFDELAEAWSTRRAAVLALMSERTLERIRASLAREFADAFILRRGRSSDDGDDHG
jgi:hypothetical protein